MFQLLKMKFLINFHLLKALVLKKNKNKESKC